MQPTDEQQVIVEAVRNSDDNILINALAGSGKTSTLELIQAASPVKPVLCLAFNRRIADEMSKRFPSTTTVRTFNGCGHRIWSKVVSSISLDSKKIQNLISEEINTHEGEDKKELREAYWEIVNAVNMAKSVGYIPEGKYAQAKRLTDRSAFLGTLDEVPSPFVLSVIDSLLCESIRLAYKGLIDFNDQVFMPALFSATFPRFPLVLVDEAQDLSPVNHALLDKLCKVRVCAVGDDFQSIYGFRGAVIGGMEQLAEHFSMSPLPLTVSFRCPSEIVKAVHWRVPEFKWIREGGIVGEIRNPTYDSFPDASAIICRNNAPLFRLAFNLLGNKRSVSVAGSEIGPRLIRILKKIGTSGDKRADLLIKIDGWRHEKLLRSQSPATINDTADCLKIFAGYGETLDSAVAYAEHLFKQSGSIKLMTGHKSKGLEFDQVFHLDSWLIGDDEQEQNLRYVISTRAKECYYEINSADIR